MKYAIVFKTPAGRRINYGNLFKKLSAPKKWKFFPMGAGDGALMDQFMVDMMNFISKAGKFISILNNKSTIRFNEYSRKPVSKEIINNK